MSEQPQQQQQHQQQSWTPPKDFDSRPICVLGGGVLGRRIASCFVASGRHVVIRDPSEKSRQDALEYIKDNIKVYTALTLHKPGTYEAVEDLQEAVGNAWLVIEAVPEVLKIKEDIFADLESHAPADCILATNSSSYKSSDLLGKVRKQETKERILNTHFMMPPEALIVEFMTCGSTNPEIFPWLEQRCREAGLHPVTALKESTGFIFNRIWAAIKRECLAVIAEGVAAPDTIDSIWIEQYSGKKLGPCKIMDSVGLDTVAHIEEHYIKDRNLPKENLDWLKENYVDKNKLGNKTPGQGGLYPAPEKGSLTRILLLNAGLAEPIKGKSLEQISHSGQILSLVAEYPFNPSELVGGLYNPDGIVLSTSTNRIYWTNMGNPNKNDGSIQTANIDGTDVKYLIEPGTVHTPKQITIDESNHRLYFCDREGLRVFRCDLDGKNLTELVKTGDWQTEPEKVEDQANWPVGITISHKLGKFFWTQKGRSKGGIGRIFSASLDMPKGETSSTRSDIELVIGGLPECIDLEFDNEHGILYWTDRGELPLGNTLNRKHLVGPVPEVEKALGREILAQGLGEGIGLKIDHERHLVYVADLGGHLWKVDTETGVMDKVFEGRTHAYTGLTFYKV